MASSNKIPLNYLVFDDEDEEINQNRASVKVPGVNCDLIFINPVNYWDKDTNEFKMDEFELELEKLLKGKQLNLIASDWNMVPRTENHNEINALEIIHILTKKHDKFKSIQYLIYSGNSKKASEVLMSKIRNESTDSNGLNQSNELLSMLLEMKIKFCSRNERFNEINTLIRNDKTISLIVLNTLNQFNKNTMHKTGNEYLDGKIIGDLLDLASSNNDLGLKFIREIIELSIAHYSKLNE